ncbi:stealth family protein [Spirilliplanes yamanashiensis]|uniref:Exopolysaccharide phosphotransferase n=1 Tax=Spirilliplanes yamanashiensis TaxID=42233 RepID=A0A8J3Y4Z0_9ACTN|nr:stealth family protein [Spirilliplanes yamanashiensis]MDP9819715.1 hypothetical protein [Spirilliplanes yamanashiensis]GIJ01465.1 exopolysaccharide phosphotransferase [Spirilliplanes yamanashiensis]
MPVRRILLLAPFKLRMRALRSVERRIISRLPKDRRLPALRRITPITGDAPRPTGVPAAVRKHNLDRVVTALDAVGVPCLRIPAADPRRTAVAVQAGDRAAVLAVLAGWERLGGVQVESAKRREDAAVISVSWDDAAYACDVEFWAERGDTFVAPRPNPVADEIPAEEQAVMVPEAVFSPFADATDTSTYRTRPVFATVAPERVRFPVDAVYTWVDGSDPAWRARRAAAQPETAGPQSANASRYASHDELRHSLRSLHAYAPWIRRVFIVTDDQVPGWLDTSHEQITVVSHREIFGGEGVLPTFNSQAIESRLHHIPGLAEHFLYLNDDVFFGRPTTPEMFFTSGGLTRFFPSPGAQMGSGPRTDDDLPVNAAGKNSRTIIERTFGVRVTRKMRHTPHPSRRSVLAELEQRFPAEVAATASHQFRHPADLALPSSLQHFWAWLTGRGVPSDIGYHYLDLAEPETPIRLAKLLRHRNVDVFCLNDTDADPATAREQAAMLREFLPAYFPAPSPYELTGPEAARPTYAPAHVEVGRQPSRAGTGAATGAPVRPVLQTQQREKARNAARPAAPAQKATEPTLHP